jgi:hypothetical protein
VYHLSILAEWKNYKGGTREVNTMPWSMQAAVGIFPYVIMESGIMIKNFVAAKLLSTGGWIESVIFRREQNIAVLPIY